MTVCIAGISADPLAIVAVTDMMVSTDESSTDGAIKIVWLTENKRWLGLYAGSPTEFFDLRIHLNRLLKGEDNPTASDMKQAAEDAHLAVIQRKVEVEILAPRGLTYADLNGGSSKSSNIGIKLRAELLEAIKWVGLETELIIAGFDSFGRPHLITTSCHPSLGRMNMYEAMATRNFHAIGAGAKMAIGWLSAHKDIGFNVTLPRLAYRMIEAKYFAEQGIGIGDALTLTVMSQNGSNRGCIVPTEGTIRGAFETLMARAPAPDAMMIVESLLPQLTESQLTRE